MISAIRLRFASYLELDAGDKLIVACCAIGIWSLISFAFYGARIVGEFLYHSVVH